MINAMEAYDLTKEAKENQNKKSYEETVKWFESKNGFEKDIKKACAESRMSVSIHVKDCPHIPNLITLLKEYGYEVISQNHYYGYVQDITIYWGGVND